MRVITIHPQGPEISSIVRKSFGIDKLLDEIMESLGKVEQVYILDDYAQGRDSGIIDVLLVGDVNRDKLEDLRRITEKKINRKVRPLAITSQEFAEARDIFMNRPHWKVV